MAEHDGPSTSTKPRRGPGVCQWLLVSGLVAGLAGCVATAASIHVRRAERAMATADHAEGAEVYPLTLARAYLEKAREEASEAHYQEASSLAKASERHARESLPDASAASEEL